MEGRAENGFGSMRGGGGRAKAPWHVIEFFNYQRSGNLYRYSISNCGLISINSRSYNDNTRIGPIWNFFKGDFLRYWSDLISSLYIRPDYFLLYREYILNHASSRGPYQQQLDWRPTNYDLIWQTSKNNGLVIGRRILKNAKTAAINTINDTLLFPIVGGRLRLLGPISDFWG